MKWSAIYNHPAKQHEERWFTEFAWLPVCIDNEWIWLEKYRVLKYYSFWSRFEAGRWNSCKWEKIKKGQK